MGAEQIVDPTVPAPPAARERLVGFDTPALLGGSCRACGGLSFPLEGRCPRCGTADPECVELPAAGRVYSFTIVRFAPPGYVGPVPYAVGVVDLDVGLRVFSTLIATPLESLEVGADVRFRLLDVVTESGVVTSYAYERERA